MHRHRSPERFAQFMTAATEANRRRPTCIDTFICAGLIRGDGAFTRT